MNETTANLLSGKRQCIVAYGCSLTASGAWVNQIRDRLESAFPGLITVVNSGQSTKCSRWGLENLGERVLAHNPDLTLIEFATNDAFLDYQLSLDEAGGNLGEMIDRIRLQNRAGAVAVQIMNPVFGKSAGFRPNLQSYFQTYRDVALQKGVHLIDHYPNWQRALASDENLLGQYIPDGLHPSTPGCERVVTPALLTWFGVS